MMLHCRLPATLHKVDWAPRRLILCNPISAVTWTFMNYTHNFNVLEPKPDYRQGDIGGVNHVDKCALHHLCNSTQLEMYGYCNEKLTFAPQAGQQRVVNAAAGSHLESHCGCFVWDFQTRSRAKLHSAEHQERYKGTLPFEILGPLTRFCIELY